MTRRQRCWSVNPNPTPLATKDAGEIGVFVLSGAAFSVGWSDPALSTVRPGRLGPEQDRAARPINLRSSLPEPVQPKNIRSLYVEKDDVKNVIVAALKGAIEVPPLP